MSISFVYVVSHVTQSWWLAACTGGTNKTDWRLALIRHYTYCHPLHVYTVHIHFSKQHAGLTSPILVCLKCKTSACDAMCMYEQISYTVLFQGLDLCIHTQARVFHLRLLTPAASKKVINKIRCNIHRKCTDAEIDNGNRLWRHDLQQCYWIMILSPLEE